MEEPKRANSIADVVAPERFVSVQIFAMLPKDSTPSERRLYQELPSFAGARAGGGTYPTLDMSVNRATYESLLERLKQAPRLVQSVIFQNPSKGPFPIAIEAYLLQDAKELVTDLF